MTDYAYVVTAGNCAYYQELVVIASSPEVAAKKFRAYLADTASDEEYEMAAMVSPDANHSDFIYDFDEDEVEVFDGDHRWLGTPTESVQMMHAGCNG